MKVLTQLLGFLICGTQLIEDGKPQLAPAIQDLLDSAERVQSNIDQISTWEATVSLTEVYSYQDMPFGSENRTGDVKTIRTLRYLMDTENRRFGYVSEVEEFSVSPQLKSVFVDTKGWVSGKLWLDDEQYTRSEGLLDDSPSTVVSDVRSDVLHTYFGKEFHPLMFFSVLRQSVPEWLRSASAATGESWADVRVEREGDLFRCFFLNRKMGNAGSSALLDPAWGMNVVRFDNRQPEGSRDQLVQTIDWELRAETFIPRMMFVEEVSKNGALKRSRKYEIQTVALNEPLSEDAFSLEFLKIRKGDRIYDARTKERTTYLGPSVPVAAEESNATTRQQLDLIQPDVAANLPSDVREKSQSRVVSVVVGALSLIALMLAMRFMRRRT